ncbi:MAG: glycosyltransferase family 39 protein [Nitrospinae bacterium]|nr:glycosyltransferase family 39 protein [Nitrospinota bacterium]
MLIGKERKHDPFIARENAPSAVAAVALIVAAATSLRLYDLASLEIWFDEAVVYLLSQDTFRYFDPSLPGDKPPLFYFFIYLWTRMGSSIFFARLLEVLAGTASVYLVYVIGRDTLGRRAAICAAVLTAFSPFEALYSREAGANMFAQMLVLASIASLVHYLKDGGRHWAIASLIFQSAAGFTSYVTLLLIPCQAAHVYLAEPKRSRQWLMWQAVALIPLLAWLGLVFQSHIVATIGYVSAWVPPLGKVGYARFLNNLVYGYYIDNLQQWALAVPVIMLASAGMANGAARRIAIYFFLPLAVFWVFSYSRHILMQRYLLCYVPALLLLMAAGWEMVRSRLLRGILAAWIGGGMVFGLMSYYGNVNREDSPTHNSRKEFSRAAAFLETVTAPGETVFHVSQNSGAVFEALRPGRWVNRWVTVSDGPLDTYRPYRDGATAMGVVWALPERFDPSAARLPAWFVVSSWPRFPYHDPEVMAMNATLKKVAAPERLVRFDGIDLVRYKPRDILLSPR